MSARATTSIRSTRKIPPATRAINSSVHLFLYLHVNKKLQRRLAAQLQCPTGPASIFYFLTHYIGVVFFKRSTSIMFEQINNFNNCSHILGGVFSLPLLFNLIHSYIFLFLFYYIQIMPVHLHYFFLLS